MLRPTNCRAAINAHSGYRTITTLGGATAKFRVTTPKGDVELAIKEKFTGPPGGANVDTTGRLFWPTAVPLLERIQAEYLSEKSTILPVLDIGAGWGGVGHGASFYRFLRCYVD